MNNVLVNASAWRRHWTFRLVAGFALCYALATIMLYALQTRMIFPGAASQGTHDARVQVPWGAELIELSAGQEKVFALFGTALTPSGEPHPDAKARPTIVFFHGNGEHLAQLEEIFSMLRTSGANVLMPDYVGYGMSTGRPSEQGCYASADAAYDWLTRDARIDRQRIIAAGWSLGAAVAVDLASRKPTAGLVMLSAFTSAGDMAALAFPLLPARWLVRHRFESLSKLGKVKCPVLLAHGTDDDIVPAAMCAQLAKAAAGKVSLLHVERASHNDFFAVGEDQLLSALGKMVEEVSR